MSDFAARISRVRMKSGGADVHLISNPRADHDEGDPRGNLVANARQIAEKASGEAPLVAYLTFGVFKDGGYSMGYRWGDATPVPRTLIPSYVAELLRRNMLMEPEAREVFNEMFEWQDG